MSKTINTEKTATGFFNPSDFFSYNADSTSENYNPSSNEMDILYIAIPDDADASYSRSAILATIAHELTHAVTFTHKTWQKILCGNTDFPQEEVFLDEGWSHLSENLCGYGISGGNSTFFKLYLQDTGSYSFCKSNIAGQADSAGMRGAMTLFMSYLFWQKGGMTWDTQNPIQLIDSGGIAFLQKLITSDTTGWHSIGNAFGKPTDELFIEMAKDINTQLVLNTPYIYKKDPHTQEAVEFFVGMDSTSFPLQYPANEKITVLPWSIRYYHESSFDAAQKIHIAGLQNNGTLYLKYMVK